MFPLPIYGLIPKWRHPGDLGTECVQMELIRAARHFRICQFSPRILWAGQAWRVVYIFLALLLILHASQRDFFGRFGSFFFFFPSIFIFCVHSDEFV